MKRIFIIHQHDPTITYLGGIGTFIRNFIKFSPRDFEIHLVGICANPEKNPVGQWQQLKMGEKSFHFLPILARDPTRRGGPPLSFQFTWALRRFRDRINFKDSLIHFHRIEPTFALKDLDHPKILFLHYHPQDLYGNKVEVTWRRFPWLYFWLERRLIHRMTHVFIVREAAVSFYQKRYPQLANRFEFLTTWVDDSIFFPLPDEERFRFRQEALQKLGLESVEKLLLFAGRFENPKNPFLLLEAFESVQRQIKNTALLLIGTGTLEDSMRRFIQTKGLEKNVRILGPFSQPQIACWMNAADLFCLSSKAEGMPFVITESLQCGLPVVCMAVGESSRLIQDSRVGRLVKEQKAEAFAGAIIDLLNHPVSRSECQKSAEPYLAHKVLRRVYQQCE